jgi:hypothetical protein
MAWLATRLFDLGHGASGRAYEEFGQELLENVMALKRIRLELARTHDQPEGNPSCGYEFTAPLDKKGKLDPRQWANDKDKCTVRRFWVDADDEHGRLTHHRGSDWAFTWPGGQGDEEPIFRFDKHAFVAGEYVSVTEHDGIQRPFRVVEVHPAA